MKHHKKILSLLFVFALLTTIIGVGPQVGHAQVNLDVQAKSAILVDAISGKILYSKDADIPLPPASMTKMMTEYLVIDAVASGKANWDDVVTAGPYAHWMGKNGGSRVFLASGEKRTIEELMYAMAVYSANDATVALAEHLAGSESNFVDLMNQKAKEFGMAQTHFITTTGFPFDQLGEFTPNNVDGEHVMSARDAAILGWHLINDYPESIKFTSTQRIKFREGEPNQMDLPNFNWMLPGLIYEYEGIDGLKTGYTADAGYNFTATAERNGMRLISVVQGTTSKEQRFAQTKKLLDYGFSNYELVDLVKAKQQVPDHEMVKVEKGKETEVSAILKNNLSIVIKKGENELYDPIVMVEDPLVAPIKGQDTIGYVTYEYSGKETYTYLNDEIRSHGETALIAENDVEKAGFIRLFFRKFFGLIAGIFTGIIDGIKGLF